MNRNSSRQVWDREYSELRVIPSSQRLEPAKILRLLFPMLSIPENAIVLDAGAGTGRNAIYLAAQGYTVHAVEFSDEAITTMNQQVVSRGLESQVHIHRASVLEPLHFEDDSFTLILDSYVLCHFKHNDKLLYKNELLRVLAPGGHLLSWVFPRDDGYYLSFLKETPLPGATVVDPNNGISKELYTREEFVAFWAPEIGIEFVVTFEFEDKVLGQSYWRKVLGLIGQKRRF